MAIAHTGTVIVCTPHPHPHPSLCWGESVEPSTKCSKGGGRGLDRISIFRGGGGGGGGGLVGITILRGGDFLRGGEGGGCSFFMKIK